MGMLLTYRPGYFPEGEPEPKAKRERKPRKPKAPEQPPAPEGYAALTDEQVLEAYVVTFPEGEAGERDAQQAELEALDAEAAELFAGE